MSQKGGAQQMDDLWMQRAAAGAAGANPSHEANNLQ